MGRNKTDRWEKAALDFVLRFSESHGDFDSWEDEEKYFVSLFLRLINRALKTDPVCKCGLELSQHNLPMSGVCNKFRIDRSRS